MSKAGVIGRIRERLRPWLKECAANDRIWNFISTFFWVVPFLLKERDKVLFRRAEAKREEELRKQVKRLSPEQKVLAGPFEGMEYPKLSSFGSSLAPKILGTYEAELHEIIREVVRRPYDGVFNVGCAEGYYAVGMARTMPEAHVYAFDILSRAREHCRLMAEANGVSARVSVEEEFDMQDLDVLEAEEDGLVLCDCEGCEQEIFDRSSGNWQKLVSCCDLVIEVHEYIRPGVSEYLRSSFEPTHRLTVIKNIDDIFRPRDIGCDALNGKTREEKAKLMAERRPRAMEWFYLVRK